MNRMLTVLLIVVLAFLLSGCDALKEKTVENSAPVIEGDGSLIFSINSEEPDWTKLVTVIDDEDGAIRVNESMVDEDVNFTVAGIYDVRYYVPDSGGKSTLFIITVEIIDDRVYTFELIGSNEINIEVFNEYSDTDFRQTL